MSVGARAASATDNSPRSTDNTTCSFRSGLLWDGLDISISLHQTQPRPEQEFVTRDTDNIAALRHCVNSLRHAGLDNQAITAIAGLDTL